MTERINAVSGTATGLAHNAGLSDAERAKVNEVIARWDGWECKLSATSDHPKVWDKDGKLYRSIPDYTNSLDSLRPVELKLGSDDYENYLDAIAAAMGLGDSQNICMVHALLASADIRAVALCKVIEGLEGK